MSAVVNADMTRVVSSLDGNELGGLVAGGVVGLVVVSVGCSVGNTGRSVSSPPGCSVVCSVGLVVGMLVPSGWLVCVRQMANAAIMITPTTMMVASLWVVM